MRKADIKAIDRIVKEEGLSREQRRMLHEEISEQDFTIDEVRAIAREIKKNHPKK